MKKDKLFALALASALLVSVLPACGAKRASDAETLSNAEAMAENTLPITAEDITLDVWAANNSQGYAKSYNDMKSIQEIGRRTGVHLDFIHPTGSTEEQLNIILSSNDYPDIIFGDWSKTGAKQLQDGIAVRLNDYIDKYAPNLKKVFEDYPGYREQLELVNGDIMRFPKLVDDPKFLCYDGYFIRKDWLEQVGKQVPSTIEEWEDVLRAFRNTDLNGNGKADEIPFSVLNWAFDDAFLTAFDIPKYSTYFKEPDRDQITHAVLQPRFREYLETMRRWYAEGLINPNYLNTTAREMDDLVSRDQLGAFYGDNNNSMPKYMQLNVGMELAAVPYPRSSVTGKQYYPRNAIKNTVRVDGAMITTSCKHVKEAVRLLDYLYSDAGKTLMNWGFEGETYTVDADGNKRFTDLIQNNPEGKTPYEAICRYMTNTGFAGFQEYAAAQALEENLPQPVKAVKARSVLYAQETDKSLIPLPAKLTVEESQRVLQRESDIDAYIREMIMKFIMGLEPLDGYDRFVETVKAMGIEDVIAVYQAAYERQGFQ